MLVVNRKTIAAGAKIRVLVVDDSDMTRRVLKGLLSGDPSIEVVGEANNGVVALERIFELQPDLITLDVNMPGMDGLETLRRVRREDPNLMVVMVSSLTNRGAAITLDALTLGANDYVLKPDALHSGTDPLGGMRHELIGKVKQFFRFPEPCREGRTGPEMRGTLGSSGPLEKPKAVVIGVSTGGPAALARLLTGLPETFPLPILVVQHMPPLFTKVLADRLATVAKLRVREATEGASIVPGEVLIAPGNYHMAVVNGSGSRYMVALNQERQENACRPAADVLFRSAARVWGGGVVGVVLTGMGKDGFAGALALKEKGAYIIAQDEASSVVWGMPGFVARAGLADAVLPVGAIGGELLRLV
jgi:two-component system chemotaxis response regulator CheB